MYEYLPIEQAKPGDIIERIKEDRPEQDYERIGFLAIVGQVYPGTEDSLPSPSKEWWKLVKTKPGSEAKVGDTVIRFKGGTRTCPTGTVFTVLKIDHSSLYYISYLSAFTSECKVLCKAEPISTEKRNLAFYKRSGKPWTDEECENIVRYVGAPYQINTKTWGNICFSCKYMYDDGSKLFYMADWYSQEENPNFKNCEQVAYEDVFETPHPEENTDTPRVAVVTVVVNGHPFGSRIVPTDASNRHWKLADGSKSLAYTHSIGFNCEWEDELVGSTWEQIDSSGARNAGDITTISRLYTKHNEAGVYYYDSNSSTYAYFFKHFKKYKPVEAVKPNPTFVGTPTSMPYVETEYFREVDKNYNPYVSYTKNPFSPATSCSQPTLNPIPEEETMNKENITIAMTADEYAKYQKSNKPAKPKTQLETAPKWITKWFNQDGTEVQPTTESPKKAKKALQHPSKLGFTFRSYLITESATTDIPVVSVEI